MKWVGVSNDGMECNISLHLNSSQNVQNQKGW